jgi:polysaccharide export outer membrane protein
MTVIRYRNPSPIVALMLAVAAAGAQAQEVPRTGGTFNTPGYNAAPAQRPGNAQGAGAQRLPGPAGQFPQDGRRSGVRTGVEEDQPFELRPQRVEPEPPKPSEFQKFVEAATGRMLPAFGARFFDKPTDRAALPGNVPVSADYAVGPGDEVVLRAWGSIDVDYRSTVDRNGMLNLPKVGSFNVTGVKASELEQHLRAQFSRLYNNFNLSVSLGQLRAVKVFVVGTAQRPGVYTLPSPSTMLSAMVAAGGPAANGSMRKILLRRDGKTISELDLYDFMLQGDKGGDLQLAAGDVVVFQPAGPRIALTGAIDTPAIYELKGPTEPVRDVLRYAGGAPVLANPNHAQLERIDATQGKAARFVERFKLDAEGLTKPLRDGDVLTLLAISPQFANAVTLKGHVAQPLRYPHRPGMRIRDLIPDRDALITPDFYRRKNLLVQVLEPEEDVFDESAARIGVEAGTNANRVNRNDALRIAGTPAGRNAPGITASTERAEDRLAVEQARKSPASLFEELNWDYAVIERLDKKDLTTQLIPFNLGKAVLQGDEAHNLELLAGDVVTVYSQKDVRVPVARQNRLVSVEGEVAAPGIYQLLPGETLKGLIARTGGFTPQAYVYGLEFSREETRQRQRENLATAIARLESLSATQSAREAANRRDDVSAAGATAVSTAATQAQLTRLTRIQPNGRIALELTVDTRTLDGLPDIPLEHADRISVPPRPAFVTVAGAVVNSNAFLWKPGRTAGDYLRLAGVDEAADPSNMFILRADGTVNHAGDRRGFWGNSKLEAEPLHPGDALIVPNQLDFETWGRALVRNLKDWSQIFSQFGLGAAAIQTLRR